MDNTLTEKPLTLDELKEYVLQLKEISGDDDRLSKILKGNSSDIEVIKSAEMSIGQFYEIPFQQYQNKIFELPGLKEQIPDVSGADNRFEAANALYETPTPDWLTNEPDDTRSANVFVYLF